MIPLMTIGLIGCIVLLLLLLSSVPVGFALALVGAVGFAVAAATELRANGVRTQLYGEKKKFKALSKGMKMKMSIAVALSHDAKLLILDEPTSGLDPVIRDEIVDIFYEFTRNPMNSILISSHIVSDLEKLCDYIAFIHKGKVILCDEKDRLLEKYCVIHCTANELSQFSDDTVMHKKESPYGVEAIVERYAADGFETNPVGIEELFVAVVRGG